MTYGTREINGVTG